jgi:SagB-type dehydrogenase family enzyme
VKLEAHGNGTIAACFGDYSVPLGMFSAEAADRAQDLRAGLPLGSFSGGRPIDKEIDFLVRRLARQGWLEYGLRASPEGEDQVVIEPQVPDYWPRPRALGDGDVLVLSRFAYMRRRGSDMVLESPRADALFRLCDPQVAAALALLATPQQIRRLRRQQGFPGVELLALLADCGILFEVEAGNFGLRTDEGDRHLVVWDFHDLLFHARSTEGRHANPIGGNYPHADHMPPLPAVRPPWPGKQIDLRAMETAQEPAVSSAAALMRRRHSVRSFDDRRPIALAELARFLDIARVTAQWESKTDFDAGPTVSYARRSYPSGGAEYSLELYLAVNACEGLARGFYHYDAGAHALTAIDVEPRDLQSLLTGAAGAMGVAVPPQILITFAARFGRVSWKYSSLAYSLVLKESGVLMQALYLMATDLGLGGCAIGSMNIDLFARMTGIEFHVEGPVGQFALGRPAPDDPGESS